MGLGGIKTAWQRQTKDFAHTKGDKYTSLVFDNRGMGESDKPLSRYSTSEMAKDTVELLDHVGWTGQRQLHIIGISMGGMIAQEMVRCMSLLLFFNSWTSVLSIVLFSRWLCGQTRNHSKTGTLAIVFYTVFGYFF